MIRWFCWEHGEFNPPWGCSMWKDEAKCPECEKLLEEQKEEEVDGID